jgi:hypothetical protein
MPKFEKGLARKGGIKMATLQGSFKTKEEAMLSVRQWRKSGFPARVKYDGISYKVYVGSFGERRKKLKRLARQRLTNRLSPERRTTIKKHEFTLSKVIKLGSAIGTDREWITTDDPDEVIELCQKGWRLESGWCDEWPCPICDRIFEALL